MTANKSDLDQNEPAESNSTHELPVLTPEAEAEFRANKITFCEALAKSGIEFKEHPFFTHANLAAEKLNTLLSKSARGLPVAGYKTTQPQWALDLVNANKVEEEKALRNIDHHASLGNEIDQRAVALTRTKIQEAYMWLNRAVFQPQRLEGDL